MSVPAPAAAWTPLPPGFRDPSLAAVDRDVIVGGGGGGVPPVVLGFTLDGAGALTGGARWVLPPRLPDRPDVSSTQLADAGPAQVCATRLDAGPVATVMIRASADFPGCLGGWYHPLGTTTWAYVGSASPEADIDANVRIAIGDGLLVTCEAEAPELFAVERHRDPAEVTWPSGVRTGSWWRWRTVPLPEGAVTSEVRASPSGRLVAARLDLVDRMRDAVAVWARDPSGWSLATELGYPGYRVEDFACTDAWLVVLEGNAGEARLRWRAAVTGADRRLEVGPLPAELHVLGDLALITQPTRALVVDLARGVLTHQVQRGGVARLGQGCLVPGFAVFGCDGQLGVARL